LNRRLRGWYGYFQGGVRNVYARLDEWLRMRLRSLLRWRVGREGRGRGRDHQRYPNAYFAELGLLSLHVRATTERTRPAARG
ncbi:MAG: group II intron maturase-specific domain-containing protein, partial [Verrucomicrobiota bacterium]